MLLTSKLMKQWLSSITLDNNILFEGDELALIKESVGQKAIPGWLSLEENTLKAQVLENPGRDAVDFEVDEAMIIEFYSR